MDVIPSAPREETEPETRIYPQLPQQFYHSSSDFAPNENTSHNFRLENVTKIQKEILDEVEHYRVVSKKYKKAGKIVHYTVFCLGGVTTAISSVAVGTSVTGIGVVVGAPLASVAAVCGVASSGLMFLSKKFEKKINKHESIHALAVAKHSSIQNYVSEALNNNAVSDAEFKKITGEMASYNALKKEVRNSFNKKQKPAPDVNIEKIRNEIRGEVREEFSKKLTRKLSTLRKISE